MFLARQTFERPRVDDIRARVFEQLDSLFSPPDSRQPLSPGARVGVTVGSRGIKNIAEVAAAAVEFLKLRGFQPFILPAMGSHAGATSEGQRNLIAHYGVTETTMGCPVLSGMATRSLGRSAENIEVFVAQTALDCDGVLLLNRVKPHTDYKGPIESGLTKICAIGLGKLEGAREYHSRVFDVGLGRALRIAAERIIQTGKILGGLAIIENAYHETARIAAVPLTNFFDQEAKLLLEACKLMGSLPISDLDLLVCDRMGKNISGTGMDTNVIGRGVRGHVEGVPWIEGMPAIYRIFVRGLTDETEGNAVGMGLADFTTPKMMNRVNLGITQLNSFTARSPSGARPPVVLPNDREAIMTALSTCPPRLAGPRIAHIRDTLSLDRLLLSEGLREEAEKIPRLEILGQSEPMQFDTEGWLQSPL
jgi:hypothetical protein